jgi:hypothetical protein
MTGYRPSDADELVCKEPEIQAEISNVFSFDFSRMVQGMGLCAFQSLETLILVVGDETGWDRTGASIREDVENALIDIKDSFVLHGGWKEWKLPEVKVVTRKQFVIIIVLLLWMPSIH